MIYIKALLQHKNVFFSFPKCVTFLIYCIVKSLNCATFQCWIMEVFKKKDEILSTEMKNKVQYQCQSSTGACSLRMRSCKRLQTSLGIEFSRIQKANFSHFEISYCSHEHLLSHRLFYFLRLWSHGPKHVITCKRRFNVTSASDRRSSHTGIASRKAKN